MSPILICILVAFVLAGLVTFFIVRARRSASKSS